MEVITIINSEIICPNCSGTMTSNGKFQLECTLCDTVYNEYTGEFYIKKSDAEVHEIFAKIN